MTLWMQRVKWPDAPHYRYEIVPLGEDEHGEWFGYPPDNPVYRGDDLIARSSGGGVLCARVGRSWTASFGRPGTDRHDIYCDIVTPVERHPQGLWCVDVDLDVIRWSDGRVELLDEDELAEHRVRYGYPDEMVAAAEAVAAEVLHMVRERRPPFDGTADRWLDRRDARHWP